MSEHLIRVVAPYVTLKVKDQGGKDVIAGFYEGAVLSQTIDPESLRHHLESGMVVEVESVEEEPPAGPVPPGGNASRDEWAAFARAKGATEEDLTDEDGNDLSRDELRTLFGSE